MSLNAADVIREFHGIPLKLPKYPTECYEDVMSKNQEIDERHLQYYSKHQHASSPVYDAYLKSFKVLAEGERVKKVYEAFIDISNVKEDYVPGDTIGILTHNSKEEVDFILEKFKFKDISDKTFEINIVKKKQNLKTPITLPPHVPKYFTTRRLFSECLDIRAVPKKFLLLGLSLYTSDPAEKRLLQILASDKYYGLKLPFIKFIEEISSCEPPVTLFIDHLPRLLPRPYSIASYDTQKTIRIIFALLNDDKKGVCTTMLENALLSTNCEDKTINMYLRQEKPIFKYSEQDLDKNIIMIGPGTGVSPFMGFLDFRQKSEKHNLGKAWLFTGCRHKEKNYLCEQEIKRYLEAGILNKVFEAFSQDEGSEFKFVQDHIEANKQEFIDVLFKEDTKLYLCGEGRTMLPKIQETIVNKIIEMKGLSRIEANNTISKYKSSGKYHYYSMIRY